MRSVRDTIYQKTQYDLERDSAVASGYKASSLEKARRSTRGRINLKAVNVQFSFMLVRPLIIDANVGQSSHTIRWDL